MTLQPIEQMRHLASALEAENYDLHTTLTTFDSGGAMLDIHRPDGRLLVMAYSPTSGFGVDEVHRGDLWQTHYEFSTDDFTSAEDQIRRLGNTCNFCVPSTIGLNLVVIYSRDIERSRIFYGRLGLSFKLEQHGSGPKHYAATLNGTVVEIYPCQKDKGTGSVRIGFQVTSVDQVIFDLKNHGIPVLTEPKRSSWGRRAVVEDPDGHCIELLETSEATNAP